MRIVPHSTDGKLVVVGYFHSPGPRSRLKFSARNCCPRSAPERAAVGEKSEQKELLHIPGVCDFLESLVLKIIISRYCTDYFRQGSPVKALRFPTISTKFLEDVQVN